MKILKQKGSAASLRLALVAFICMIWLLTAPLARAANDTGCDPGAKLGQPGYCGKSENLGQNASCQGNSSPQTCLKSLPFIHTDVQSVVDFLSGFVGIVIVGVIIAGGIQYSMAGDNAQAVTAAKGRITNGFIALAIFLFMFALLQWLIPGGIFG